MSAHTNAYDIRSSALLGYVKGSNGIAGKGCTFLFSEMLHLQKGTDTQRGPDIFGTRLPESKC